MRNDLLEEINLEIKTIDALSKSVQCFRAGIAYCGEIAQRSHTIGEHISRLNKLLVESGIWEEAGGKPSGLILGDAPPLTKRARRTERVRDLAGRIAGGPTRQRQRTGYIADDRRPTPCSTAHLRQ